MIRQIVVWPDSRLKQESQSIETFHQSIRELEHDLIETCKSHQGAGLAAIQIGVPSRALVVLHEGNYVFMANPAIVEFKGEKVLMQEGCLSFPGIVEEIKRWQGCVVYYKDSFGALKELDATGLTAQAIQHEQDHCEGIVLPDRLDGIKKNRFWKKYSKSRE